MHNERNTIQFLITSDQAKQICNHYNTAYEDLDDSEICELLNQLIDETTIKNF